MIKVLFVCMGNICRSPTAHGVFESMVEQAQLDDQIEVDSAGTHAYHVGAPPDSRTIATARNRGVELKHLRARVIEPKDFAYYDYILVMDKENLENVSHICPKVHLPKVALFLNYLKPQEASDKLSHSNASKAIIDKKHYIQKEVPDPYYTTDGFDEVFDLIENASYGLLEQLIREQKSTSKR